MYVLDQHKYLSEEKLKEMGTIYKKESKRPLSSYQRRINEAAQKLCIKNPGLLHQRKLLIEEARKKIIDEGFQFVKGKSRSKRCANPNDIQPSSKRRKTSRDMRAGRMKNIEEDCQDLTDRISYREKRIRACENISDYKKCDELKEEISALKRQRRELKAELKQIEKSNYQSEWDFKKKGNPVSEPEASSSSDRSRSSTPFPSRCSTPLPRSSSEVPSSPLYAGSPQLDSKSNEPTSSSRFSYPTMDYEYESTIL